MKIIRNILRIFLPLILGSIVGLIIQNSMDYTSLNQPPLSPSPFAFPIAWTLLYLLMGISYNLYRKENQNPQTIFLYYLQLGFNLLWSIFFFTLKWRGFSVEWILLLDVLIILLIKRLYQEKKVSAFLLFPYLIWCLFATYLNIGIYWLN